MPAIGREQLLQQAKWMLEQRRREVASRPDEAGACPAVSPDVLSQQAGVVPPWLQMAPDVPARPVLSREDENGDSNPPHDTLTPRHLAAARLIARGKTVGHVAGAIGVSRRSISRWMRHGDFRAELRRIHLALCQAGGAP